jgi:microcystin-dependent protein
MIDGFLIKQGITLQGLSSAPSNPLNGDIYYDNTLNAFQFYQDGAWIYAGVPSVISPSGGGTGTNTTPSDGQLLIGNGTNYTVANLTAGTNVSISNGPGSITINASGGGGGASPSGSIVAFGGSVAPSGWLICDGSAVSRSTYSALFAAIATNYGDGDGSTTFNLPDTRGYFLRGWDNGAGNDPDSSSRTSINGGNTGDNVGSYQGDQFTSHNHSASVEITGFGGFTSVLNTSSTTSNSSSFPVSVASNGGNETRPINLYVTYIIKT